MIRPGSPSPLPSRVKRRWFGGRMTSQQYNPNSFVLLIDEMDLEQKRFMGLYRVIRWFSAVLFVGMVAFLVVALVEGDIAQTAKTLVARFSSSTGTFSIFKAKGIHVPDP